MVYPSILFRDRHDAGLQLAEAIAAELHSLTVTPTATPVVYALPKGGLPVAEPISQRLGCPLDLVVAKKVTRPDNPELAIGAVTADGYVIRSRQASLVRSSLGNWRTALSQAQSKAKQQQAQFNAVYAPVSPEGAIAILVDDGIATGMTMAVAARSLLAKRPAALLICAPVAPEPLLNELKRWCDRVVILATPPNFLSVSRFYIDFHQVEMEEAIACLQRQRLRLEMAESAN
ncbi:MAG TPA: phosphoribosyltransferase family protein [Chroococcidiopsis sp.]